MLWSPSSRINEGTRVTRPRLSPKVAIIPAVTFLTKSLNITRLQNCTIIEES